MQLILSKPVEEDKGQEKVIKIWRLVRICLNSYTMILGEQCHQINFYWINHIAV